MDITVRDETTGAVIVHKRSTTDDNGFVGLWLPRDLTATLTVEYQGRGATSVISTDDADDATCLTTMRLAWTAFSWAVRRGDRAKPHRDEHGGQGDHEGHAVRYDQRDVMRGDSVGDPQREAGQQDQQVSQGHVGCGATQQHAPNLQQRG
jgi:hypothetical protein